MKKQDPLDEIFSKRDKSGGGFMNDNRKDAIVKDMTNWWYGFLYMRIEPYELSGETNRKLIERLDFSKSEPDEVRELLLGLSERLNLLSCAIGNLLDGGLMGVLRAVDRFPDDDFNNAAETLVAIREFTESELIPHTLQAQMRISNCMNLITLLTSRIEDK